MTTMLEASTSPANSNPVATTEVELGQEADGDVAARKNAADGYAGASYAARGPVRLINHSQSAGHDHGLGVTTKAVVPSTAAATPCETDTSISLPAERLREPEARGVNLSGLYVKMRPP
jgi:hypothetical protein